MSFIWPAMLISLLLIPLAVGLYIWLQRRRQQRIARFGSFGLAFTGGKSLGARRHIPPVLFLLGMALLLIAFVIVATGLAHRFWEFPEAQQQAQMNNFLKNVALIGGLLFYYVSGPGAWSLAGRSAGAAAPEPARA